MKIVILDGYTINPGDLDWKPLEEFGEVISYPRTNPEDTLKRASGAEAIITSKVILDKNIIENLPELKYVGVIATGYNVVDLEYAKEKGIVVTNIPNYCTSSVAQMVFAHLFNFARRVDHHSRSVKDGNWSKSTDFCFWDYPQIEMNEKVLGLIGCGNIGNAVTKIAKSMDMKVIVHDPYAKKHPDVEFVELDTVFKESDFLSLHCPLTDETKYIIRKENISKMKKTAFIVNTGRGPLINELELADTLNEGIIAGAGLDVLEVEPPNADNPLFKAKNCQITPHVAWASIEARKRLIQFTMNNLKAFMEGKSINVVN
ncbi:MAG: D-2-hydroxyacid dehydrogenase [Bacteriovoracaceae bacterium]|nr:D-2-hydroxyacid dehydrogenase [Bacteriovoracaceae bacterium]